jgi:predicted metalloprotease with PDZ domain
MPLEALAREYTNLSRDYYPNPYRNVSADSASGAFWLSKEGERLPYARGSLYFMDLNARIKKASGGRRSLDDVMFALFAKRAASGPLSTDAFLASVAGELGPGAAAEFDSIVVRGTKTIVLAPDTFGPCFSRRTVTIPVPDFLFRRNETRRIVTGLRGESAAFQAGLRDGDEVTNQVDVGALTTGTAPVVLEIRRGQQPQTIRYVPRPLAVESYEWTVAPGVAEATCRAA